MNKQQEKDSKRCEEMAELGRDMDCTSCSCSVCIAQEPTKVALTDLKQFISYAYGEGVIDNKIQERLFEFSEYYINSIV
jgi:hypothetical protein